METKEVTEKLGTNVGFSKFASDIPMDNPLITAKLKGLIVECFMATEQSQWKYEISKILGLVDDEAIEEILNIHIDQCFKDIKETAIKYHLDNIVSAFS